MCIKRTVHPKLNFLFFYSDPRYHSGMSWTVDKISTVASYITENAMQVSMFTCTRTLLVIGTSEREKDGYEWFRTV